MKIKLLCTSLGLSWGSLVLNSTSANALTWTLQNVTFSDGATASGSFDYLGGSNYQSFNITITGPKLGGSIAFTDANSFKSAANNDTRFRLANPSFSINNPYFYFKFSQSLPTTGDGSFNISILPSSPNPNFQQDVSQYGLYRQSNQVNLISGNVTTSAAVPWEFSPTQGILLGLPLFLGLRVLKYRKYKSKLTSSWDCKLNCGSS